MYNEWSLDALYSGIDDPKLQSDMEKLQKLVDGYKATVAAMKDKAPLNAIRDTVEILEEMRVHTRRLGSYFSLRRSVNGSDKDVAAYQTKMQAMLASNAKEAAMFEKYVGSIEDLDALIDIARSVAGVEIAFSIREEARDLFRISARSNSNADVSALCAYFGGGGHVKAAGCTVSANTIEKARELIIERAEKLIS